MAVNRRIIIKRKIQVKMAQKISLYNTATSSQRDLIYLLTQRNKKVLCPVCKKTSVIYSRHLNYKTMHGNNVFIEQVLVACKRQNLSLNFYLTLVFLEICPKPHKRKK
jgi:hypothetical protein